MNDPSKFLYPNALRCSRQIYFIQNITYRFNLIFKREIAQICLMNSKAESKSQYFQICFRLRVWEI